MPSLDTDTPFCNKKYVSRQFFLGKCKWLSYKNCLMETFPGTDSIAS